MLGIVLGFLIAIPITVWSASNLAERLSGRLLLAVEDNGSIWYVNPEDNKKYSVTFGNALSLFEKLSLGITNKDLDGIETGEGVVNKQLPARYCVQGSAQTIIKEVIIKEPCNCPQTSITLTPTPVVKEPVVEEPIIEEPMNEEELTIYDVDGGINKSEWHNGIQIEYYGMNGKVNKDMFFEATNGVSPYNRVTLYYTINGIEYSVNGEIRRNNALNQLTLLTELKLEQKGNYEFWLSLTDGRGFFLISNVIEFSYN